MAVTDVEMPDYEGKPVTSGAGRKICKYSKIPIFEYVKKYVADANSGNDDMHDRPIHLVNYAKTCSRRR